MPATPHINPQGAPIAPTVLLPGDPLRAKFVAESFLEDVVQFNSVRNMLGFTGTYRGTPVSVMGSGMGIPSISLYAHELIDVFGATTLVRIGSCGALRADISLLDVVVAQGACTDSRFIEQYNLPGTFAPLGSWDLLQRVAATAAASGTPVRVGNIVSSDVFYNDDPTVNERWANMGVLAVEMESAGLYAVAARAGVQALGMFSVSDNIVTGQSCPPEERETGLSTMIRLALDTTCS